MSDPNIVQVEMGSPFIGFTVSLSLYGAALAQAIFYFRSFPDDCAPMKILVTFISFLDIFHVCLLSQMFWNTLVYGRLVLPSVPQQMPWQLVAATIVTNFIIGTVHCFFCLRVWRVSKNKSVTAMIGILTVMQFGVAMSFGVQQKPTGSRDPNTNLSAQIQLISSMVCDIVISASLVYYFHSFRLGMKRTEVILQELIILSVNMGVMLCLVMTVTIILFEVDAGISEPLAAHMVLSKIYVNSLIATLNSRRRFRAIANRTIAFSLPTISTGDSMPVFRVDSGA